MKRKLFINVVLYILFFSLLFGHGQCNLLDENYWSIQNSELPMMSSTEELEQIKYLDSHISDLGDFDQSFSNTENSKFGFKNSFLGMSMFLVSQDPLLSRANLQIRRKSNTFLSRIWDLFIGCMSDIKAVFVASIMAYIWNRIKRPPNQDNYQRSENS